MKPSNSLYGLLAEFSEPDALLQAARACRARYRHIDAHSPYPLPQLSEILGFKRDRVALVTLIAGLLGGASMYFLQWYSAVIDYPMNIGGRPPHSWPAFLVPTFEVTVLSAVMAAFGGMLFLNGLPRLNHPVFNVTEFERISRDRFCLIVRSTDPQFELRSARIFLETLTPLKIIEIPLCES